MDKAIEVSVEEVERVLRDLRSEGLRTVGLLAVSIVLYGACAWLVVDSAYEDRVLSCIINAIAAGANQNYILRARSMLTRISADRARLVELRQRIIEANGRKA